MAYRVKKPNLKSKEVPRSISESILLLFPLLLIATVLPLLVKVHQYNTDLIEYNWFAGDGEMYDYFLYYKQWFFVGMCSIIVIIITIRSIINKNTLKFTKTFIPLVIYASFSLISTLLSNDMEYGIKGNYDQFENIFCLIGYILVVYYCYLIIQTESELRLLIDAIALGALIIGLIGVFQAIGHDFFNTPFGQRVITNSSVNSIKINFEVGRVYTTMYNPNYVGVYTSLIIPIFTVLLFFSKKIYEFVLYSLVIITSMISLFGSQSKAGIISIVISLVLSCVLLRRELIKKWFITIPLVMIAFISFLVINHLNDNAYINSLLNIFNKNASQKPSLTEIETGSEYIELVYNGNILRASMSTSGDLILKDGNNKTVPYAIYEQNDDVYIFAVGDSRYSDISPVVYKNDVVDFSLVINDTIWAFQYNEDAKKYLYYNRYARFSPIKTAESAIFNGNESFASDRGYIWSRTIPLLKDTLIIGTGADTFAQNFTQYDYVGFYNFGYENRLITKPHSLYLQIGIQTGGVSLIAFMIYFAIYILQSCKLYFRNNYDSKTSHIGLAVLIGIVAFLVSGISNDSTICVTPIFWLIVGIGFVANHITKKNMTVMISKDI